MTTGAPGHFGVTTSMDSGPITRGLRQIDQASQHTTSQLQRLTTAFATAFQRPAQALIFLGLDLQQLGRSLAVVGGATVAAGAASSKFAIDFGTALANVNALAQLTDRQLLVLGERIRTLATDPQVLQGPTELANAFQFLISSGFSVANGLSVLRVASVGATAGNADLETVTRSLASTLNALPRGTITAQKAIDILFETVDKGIITFEELTSTMGEALGAVGATGIPFEEFGAAVSVITRAGIPASQTMTSINQVLRAFIAPSTEAKKIAAELGLEFSIAALRTKGFAVAMDEIARAVGDDTEKLDKLFGDVRAFRGVLAVTGGGGIEEFNALLESQKKATEGLGAANAALEEQLKAPAAAFKLLQRDIEAAGIKIGEDFIPMIIQATRIVRDLAEGFAELPVSLKTSILFIGGAFAGLGALAFVAGTTFTAVGALKNLFGTFGAAASGASGGIRITSQAMREQAIAAETAALANTALARSLGTVGTAGAANAFLARSGGGPFGSSVVQRGGGPLGSSGIAVARLGTASTAATLSFGSLLGVVGQVAIWGTLALAIKEVVGSLVEFTINSELAKGSTKDLLRAATAPKQGFLGLPTGFLTRDPAQELLETPEVLPEFVQQRAQQRGISEQEAIEAGRRQAEIATAAIEQAAQAQEAAFTEAESKVAQAAANFQKAIAEAGDDPELKARLEASLNRLQEEGPGALLESGFLQLNPAQRAAIINRFNFTEEIARNAEKAGDQAGANLARGMNEAWARAIGFEHGISIDIQADFAPAITAAKNEVTRIQKDLADALAPGEKALKGLEAAQKSARIEQLRLNLAMQDAQRAFKIAQEAVKAVEDQIKALDQVIQDLEQQLQEAQGRLSNLGQTQEFGIKFVLQGLPEIENAIFNISQQIAGINLEILNVQAGFTPGIFDAQEEVLRTRLALLLAGDAAEDLGKKASFGIDDLISAQQRELREGVPVLRTIFDKIRAAEAGEDGGQEESPEEKANKAAQERLEILQIEQQLATIQLQKQLEIAQQEERRLQLTKQITFDPQIRELEQLATTTKEITFEEAKAAIIASREEMTTLQQRITEAKDEQKGLNDQLAAANDILAGRQEVVDSLSAAQEALQQRMTEFQLTEATILESQARIQETFAGIIETAKNSQIDLEQRARTQAPSPLNIPSDQSTWSSDVGNDYPIPFSTEEQQKSNADIRSIQQNTAASLQLMDSAAGGIAEILLRLLATIGMAGSGTQLAGVFHEGGRVQGLTPGTEVPARLLVGEHVLSRGQVHVLRSAGIDPSHVHELVGAIRSLPRYHEGGPVAMVSAPAVAPMSSSPMALPSGGSSWNWAVTINNSGGGDVYGKFMREVYSRRLGGRWR